MASMREATEFQIHVVFPYVESLLKVTCNE